MNSENSYYKHGDTFTMPHLNTHGLEIRATPDRGRGVYATHVIPRGTLIEISPVLFFAQDEYARHGKHTVLDHYTFVWGDGRMVLPLGLGSLFNHSSSPNVNYIKKKNIDCIEYWTSRTIQEGEELCIFYGHTLWFVDSAASPNGSGEYVDGASDDSDAGLASIDL